MSLKLYIVGRERRVRASTPVRERRRAAGSAGLRYIGIPDRTVSRRHAEIYIVDARIFVRDLRSKNGTFLLRNGRFERFDEGFVEPGATIRFADSEFVIDELLLREAC